MPNKWIPYVKVLVHLVCLLPAVQLIQMYRSGALALMADPVNWITHFTGHYTLLLLIVCLAVTPVRRLHPKLANLIRMRRLLGLYAFFYATLHLGTYVFLFSGYDVPTVWAGLKAGHLGVVVDQWKLIWPTILGDLKKRRFIQVGFFAWVLLLILAATSPAFVMRAMGGKNWRRVHWSVYVAALAGITHYWWLVKKGVLAPMPFTLVLFVLLGARVFWWAKGKLVRRGKARPVAVSS
ncbi:MAG TPA: protein-methionine-sulfoxide reductase heme-binding subunit MsrQ [Acidobacteriaceae bacterium]|jgi:sulfoxide reductase heme-binding subunit YedZ|nr:protein-methionine-sulfoxide reductase heme-binding subunit MsrQ [Acidobacteriaceae bacterium]